LEGAQAGLSWSTVLKKRENYREAFDGFDPKKIAEYGDNKVAELMANPGIIRNRLKVSAAIGNAKAYLTLEKNGDPFDQFLWSFVQNKAIQNNRHAVREVPATSRESDAMSKALSKAGFKFVGSTICYAFMQASGMVNDHLVSCHRYSAVRRLSSVLH
jgi:DNA-3-methyladenine glycosylase I